MTICKIDDCTGTARARGLCNRHYHRLRKHADPLAVAELRGRPLAGAVPTWGTIHKRLTRTRGPAAALSCVDCDGPAAEWSYDLTDPDERSSVHQGHRLRYSLDLDRYVPRCVRCHRLFDRAAAAS